MSTKNTFVSEPNRLVVYDDLGSAAVNRWLAFGDDEYAEAAKELLELFEVIEPHGHFMADPNEDFYQGIEVMSVLKRKSDGRLFGYKYWTPISKHGESSVEPNGEDNGLEFEVPDGFNWNEDYYPSAYVWLPIEPFTITGYKITETNAANTAETSN